MNCPDSPESVALALTRLVIESEGVPIEQLKPDSKPGRTIRSYILDTYAECLLAVRGQRRIGLSEANGNGLH